MGLPVKLVLLLLQILYCWGLLYTPVPPICWKGMRKLAVYFQSHEENQPSYLEVYFFLLPLVVFLCLVSPWLTPCDIRIPHHINTFRGIQLLLCIGTALCCHHVDLHSEEMLLAAQLVGMSRPSKDISHNFCSLHQSQCIILVVTTFHRPLKIIQDSTFKANLVSLFSYAKIM